MKKLNDRYYLDSDTYSLILCEKKTAKKGKNQGQEYYEQIGFYGRIEDVYKAIVEKEIKSDLDILDNIQKVVDLINEIRGKDNAKS